MKAVKNYPRFLGKTDDKTFSSEREILYKILFDMKSDMSDLKKLVYSLMREGTVPAGGFGEKESRLISSLLKSDEEEVESLRPEEKVIFDITPVQNRTGHIQDTEEFVEESLSLTDKEVEMIRKALEKNSGKRKAAAQELGISERTLYRKIKEYGIDV